MVFRVVDVVEIVEAAVLGFAEDAAAEEEEEAEDAEAEVGEEEVEAMPVDSEIKLPPLDNKVTVCCPLTTTVGAVTVVCGAPLLCDGPELAAEEAEPLALDTTAVLVVVKSKEYVVLGSKLDGNVARADESTESAFMVWAGCSVEVAGHPAILSAQEVIVV
ncbi:hypothetical protein QM012_002108 [Aureobasidium pullulans]|uniref:Secreted protein n=1 Tax=Aureobasidium pullulans TaxID=5580 RepID=A0ABR0TER4_AURPU